MSDDPRLRELLITLRQSLLIALGAIERFLGMPPSVIPKHKRDR